MNDKPSFNFRWWLRDTLTALVAQLWGKGWTLLPIHEADLPGVWVTMAEPAYQALIPYGYPYPDGQDVDWDNEPELDDDGEML